MNLFENLPADATKEVFETLVTAPGIKIERTAEPETIWLAVFLTAEAVRAHLRKFGKEPPIAPGPSPFSCRNRANR